MKKKSIFWGVCVIDALALSGCMYLYMHQDRTPPVISFTEKETFYTDEMENSELLEGVNAFDEQDGNVSYSLLVEKISKTGDGKVIVTYAAKDSSNNIAKSSRILPIEEFEEEEVETEAEIFLEMESESETEEMDTSEQADEPEAEEDEQEDERSDENLSADAVENREIENRENEAPVLTLTTDTILVNAGITTVDWSSYIQQLADDRDSREQLFGNLVMEGHVDLNTPGNYPVVVYTRDSDGAVSERRNISVIVV